MVIKQSSPFGSRSRTRALLALSLLGESHARELSRLLDSPLAGIQRALRGLERDGLVAGRLVGRTRAYQLDPRYPIRAELAAYLARLAPMDRELVGAAAAVRRRPRRSGKPL